MEQKQIETQGHRALIADHCQLAQRVDALTELQTALAETVTSLDARTTKLERIYREMLEDHVTLMHQTEACENRLKRLEDAHDQLRGEQVSQQEDVQELQYLLSEEIMDRLTKPLGAQEVVAELGHGWRIERQPAPPNGEDATSDLFAQEEMEGMPAGVKFFSGWCPDSETGFAWHFIDSDGVEVCTCKQTHFTPPAPYPVATDSTAERQRRNVPYPVETAGTPGDSYHSNVCGCGMWLSESPWLRCPWCGAALNSMRGPAYQCTRLSGTPGDSWLLRSWVTQFAAAVDGK